MRADVGQIKLKQSSANEPPHDNGWRGWHNLVVIDTVSRMTAVFFLANFHNMLDSYIGQASKLMPYQKFTVPSQLMR